MIKDVQAVRQIITLDSLYGVTQHDMMGRNRTRQDALATRQLNCRRSNVFNVQCVMISVVDHEVKTADQGVTTVPMAPTRVRQGPRLVLP